MKAFLVSVGVFFKDRQIDIMSHQKKNVFFTNRKEEREETTLI